MNAADVRSVFMILCGSGGQAVSMDDQNLTDEPLEQPLDAADELTEPAADTDDGAAGEAVTSPSTIEEEIPLDVQLERAEARAAEYLDSLQRERASFQNYRKRVERDRIEQTRAISGELVLRLLPVLDDFYRAMDAVPEQGRDQWFEGVTLILRKLERFLADEGVTEIQALGQPFDPAYHEAVGVDDGAEAESGTVIAVLQRGFLLGDRVLRPALVRVAG
jgi:molecular chaperone GrpE